MFGDCVKCGNAATGMDNVPGTGEKAAYCDRCRPGRETKKVGIDADPFCPMIVGECRGLACQWWEEQFQQCVVRGIYNSLLNLNVTNHY